MERTITSMTLRERKTKATNKDAKYNGNGYTEKMCLNTARKEDGLGKQQSGSHVRGQRKPGRRRPITICEQRMLFRE